MPRINFKNVNYFDWVVCPRNSDKHPRHSDEIAMPNTIIRVKFMIFETHNEWRRIVENHPLVWYSNKRRDWKWKKVFISLFQPKGRECTQQSSAEQKSTRSSVSTVQLSVSHHRVNTYCSNKENLICCQMRTKMSLNFMQTLRWCW